MRQSRLQVQLSGVGHIGTEGDTVFNILDYVKNPGRTMRGLDAVDNAYFKLQREIYEKIVIPRYDAVTLPEDPPNEWWSRTTGSIGALIYFPAGRYLWEGVPQLWPKTGLIGDGYYATMFEYSGNVINSKRPDQLPHWHIASNGDSALLVLGDCTIMGTKLKGMNHGVRDIRFIPGQGGRNNTGIVMAGTLMNQQIRDCNMMQHSSQGEAFCGLASLPVQGDWTPESLDGIYNVVKVNGGRTFTGHVNDLVVDNLQIEGAEVSIWLDSVVWGHVSNCRHYHAKVGEIYTSCHDIRVSNMATSCDLGGYYNKAMQVQSIIGQKVSTGYAYKASSRDDRDERLDLKFDVSGNATKNRRVAVGSQFDEPLGIWNAGDIPPGS